MAKSNIKTTGTIKTSQQMKSYLKQVEQITARHLYQEGEGVMADSKTNYVPVDEGTLKTSGHVQLPKVGNGKIEVVLGYGGAAKAYALTQHENMTFHHTVGQAKYLSIPFKKALSGLKDRLVIALNIGVKIK